MPEQHQPTIRRRVAIEIVVLLALEAAVVADLVHPVVETTSGLMNALVVLCASLLPWVALVRAAHLRPRRLRLAVQTALAMLGVPSLLLTLVGVLGVGLADPDGYDPGLTPTAAVQVGPTRVVAYETNGGATTDFGLQVRAERPLGPGIQLIHTIYTEYHARGGRVVRAGGDRVQIYAHYDSAEVDRGTRRVPAWPGL